MSLFYGAPGFRHRDGPLFSDVYPSVLSRKRGVEWFTCTMFDSRDYDVLTYAVVEFSLPI